MTDVEKPKPISGLQHIYDWMHEKGEPTRNEFPADTIILMDIAVSLRRLVALSEESMRMNQAILMQLDRDETGQTQN